MKPKLQEYCLDLSNYRRLPTREVSVGDVLIGAENPIKVQSMTTTDTMDTQGTIAQSIKMIDAGCELVRITCLLYTSPSPRDRTRSRMPSSA